MFQFSATFTDLIKISKQEMRTASGLHTQVSTFSRHIVNFKKSPKHMEHCSIQIPNLLPQGFAWFFMFSCLQCVCQLLGELTRHAVLNIHSCTFMQLLVLIPLWWLWLGLFVFGVCRQKPPLRINKKSMKTLDKTELSWHCDLAKFRNNHVQPEIGFFLRRPRK